MKKTLISLLLLSSTLAYANNSDSPQTINVGKKAIQSTIKGHIFWVEADDGKQYRHRVINYHDFKYNLDEGPSHNYFITLRLKDIDDPKTQTIDCKTSLNYDYPTGDIDYPDSIDFRWCQINEF